MRVIQMLSVKMIIVEGATDIGWWTEKTSKDVSHVLMAQNGYSASRGLAPLDPPSVLVIQMLFVLMIIAVVVTDIGN